jgi:hypothetical protein
MLTIASGWVVAVSSNCAASGRNACGGGYRAGERCGGGHRREMIGVVVEYTVHQLRRALVLVGAGLGGGDHQDGEDNGDTVNPCHWRRTPGSLP